MGPPDPAENDVVTHSLGEQSAVEVPLTVAAASIEYDASPLTGAE